MFSYFLKLGKTEKPAKPATPFTARFNKNLNQIILDYLNVSDLIKITQSNKIFDLETQLFLQIPSEQLLKNKYKNLLKSFGEFIDKQGLRKYLAAPSEITAEDTLEALQRKYRALYNSVEKALFRDIESSLLKKRDLEFANEALIHCCYNNPNGASALLAKIRENNRLLSKHQIALISHRPDLSTNFLKRETYENLATEAIQLIQDQNQKIELDSAVLSRKTLSPILSSLLNRLDKENNPDGCRLFYNEHISYFNPSVFQPMFQKKSLILEKKIFVEFIQKKLCDYFEKAEIFQQYFPDNIREYYDACLKIFVSDIFSKNHEKIGVDPMHRNWLEKRVFELREMLGSDKVNLSRKLRK